MVMDVESLSDAPGSQRNGSLYPTLSVVVPLYNEEEVVAELVRRVVESCRRLGSPFEFLTVNDGSQDETLPRLVQLSREIPELRVINLFRNFGHMAALTAGIALARGDAVLVMDGDLQDPPELIPKFFGEWHAGAEVVYGLRAARRETFLRRVGTGVFYWILSKITETRIPRQAGMFSLMDRRVIDALKQMPERQRYLPGLRAWIGGKQSFVTYDRPERASGKSRVGDVGLFRLARMALLSFSKVPLRYAALFSLLCGLLMFLIGSTAILVRVFTRLAIPGWATTTTLIGMMGFVQSSVLAIISEYIAVIFDELKARPVFLIREEFRSGKPALSSP
jgi:dolichol-phosphate mannosyltransferase